MKTTILNIFYTIIIIKLTTSCDLKPYEQPQTCVPYYIREILCKKIAFSIDIDQNGNKWLGTGHGILKFDGNNWYTFYTKYELEGFKGLTGDTVWAVKIDDQDNKWYGTWRGMSMLKKQ